MKKLLFAIIALAFIAVSCENTATKSNDGNTTEKVVISEEITPVAMADFDSLVENLAGRKISISGTVDHVCEHGGQKMFIVDEASDTRLKIVPNEEIAAFNTDLVGETVNIVGIVEEMRVDEDYLKEWEEEVKSGAEEKEHKSHNEKGKKESADAGDHGDGHENPDISAELEQIARMRTRVEESEKGYLSFYSILAVEYNIYKID